MIVEEVEAGLSLFKEERQRRWAVLWGLFDSREKYISPDDLDSELVAPSFLLNLLNKSPEYLKSEMKRIDEREMNLVAGGEQVENLDKSLRSLSNYRGICRGLLEETNGARGLRVA